MSTCQQCNKEFVPRDKYRPPKTCSKECRYLLSAQTNRASQKSTWVPEPCPQCGGEVSRRAIYCSKSCANQSRSSEPRRRAATCPTCGEDFTTSTPGQTFCSRPCIRGKGRTFETCPCGERARTPRAKYCSEECRRAFGTRRNAARMVTRTCLGCGEEFTRPHWYPGKMKYCSNRCSHVQQKKVRDKFIADLPEGAVVFHSGWEIRFWAACLRHEVPIRVYDGEDIETSEGNYRPDFIVGLDGGEEVVDVKGYFRPESMRKVEEAQTLGLRVHIVREDELRGLEESGIVVLRKS